MHEPLAAVFVAGSSTPKHQDCCSGSDGATSNKYTVDHLCQIKRTREDIFLVCLSAAGPITSAPRPHLELYPFCQVSQQLCF